MGGLGSGLNGEPLVVPLCANSPCGKQAPKFCKDCKLVGYCSKDCQRQHWHRHKLLCRSNLIKGDGLAWMREGRLPPCLGNIGPNPLEERLWGNVPAYGLLGAVCPANSDHDDRPLPLRLCFAASGDLRNVIETLCQLPDASFHGSITVHLNDINPKVVVRNFLMLELLRLHGDEAIDAVIALWYSLALTPAQLHATMAIAERVLAWPARGDYHHSSSSFGRSSGPPCLVAKLHKQCLGTLQSLCDNCIPLSQAKASRTKIMEGRPVLVERRMGCQRPSHRVAWNHFRQTGVVIPLAVDLDKHMINQANRFLLLPSVGWALGDGGSDPLHGWDLRQMLAAGLQHGVPSMDLYGCLFFHIRDKLHNFIQKWMQCNVTFILTDMAATKLAGDFRRQRPIPTFHRIDTSNIADESYEGVKRVLIDWGPLLAEPLSSPIEPILITYFMNWGNRYNAMKPAKTYFDVGGITAVEITKARPRGQIRGMEEMTTKLTLQGELDWYRAFHDFSSAFKEYLQMHGAEEAAEEVGVCQRRQHALVPHRLFVSVEAARNATPAQYFASVDDLYFVSALASGLTLLERFVEWGPK